MAKKEIGEVLTMKKYYLSLMSMILLALLLFFLPLPAASQIQEKDFISLGPYQIHYNQSIQNDTDNDGVPDKTSYFIQDTLVLTIWDYNQDGLPDAWFSYDEEEYLILQAEDLNADGQPDEFLHFDREEKLTKRETKEEIEIKPESNAPVLSPKPAEEALPAEKFPNYTFISDHGKLSLTITNLELETRASGELAWILELSIKVENDLSLYATEYWFIYPDCPQEDVYACGDSTGITYDYINNPTRNYEKIFPEYHEKWYDAGQTVSRRFTLPLCIEAYQQHETTRVNLVQAVEYYLDSEGRVETLEWEFYSP